MLSSRVWQAWIPPDSPRAVEWIPANVVIPEETETPGLFDLDLFPHVRGVLEAIDDPMTRQVFMQWAARNAKTTTMLSIALFFAVNAPRPALFGSSTEEKADETIDSQLYPLLEACAATRPQLRPPHERNQRYVALDRCRIRRSFSGSPSSMAGFPACYGFASEVSKWSRKKSTEADPIQLFTKRAMLYPFESKYLFESTPGLKGSCNISRLMRDPGTDRRRRWVPCPHCGEFQLLKWGSGEAKTGGVRWDKGPAGRSERQVALETAWYECEHCCKRIEDLHRPAMMRGGMWLSDGLTIDRKRKIHGTAKVRSANVGFGPLSALYSLAISGWGQLAGEFLDSRKDIESKRDFANSVLAEEWDPKPVAVWPHELTERLATQDPRGVCPDWSTFVTMAVDVQTANDTFPWVATAWGAFARGHVIDAGVCYTEADLEKHIRGAAWPHADKGAPLPPVRTLIDAGDGHVTERVYAFCRRVPNCLPCKGSRHSTFPQFSRLQSLIDSPAYKKAAKAGQAPTTFSIAPFYLEINTERTQRWLQALLQGDVAKTDPEWFSLNAEAAVNHAWLQELLAEYPHDENDLHGYLVSTWTKTGPNEARDLVRYNRALADLLTQSGRHWDKQKRAAPTSSAAAAPAPPRLTMPDGRPYLMTER